MALDRELDSDRDQQADDTTRTQPAMGGKGDSKADDDIEARIRQAAEERTKKLNHENKTHRLRAKELEERLAEIEKAQREAEEAALPELDKARKRIEKYEADLSERQADLEAIASAYDALQVKFAAFQAGATKVRPERMDAVLRLLDLDAIDRDDDTGEPVGIDKAIDAVLKEYPEFAAAHRAAGTPPVPTGGGTPPRRGVGAGTNGGGSPVDRATQQLIESGKYQRL